MEAILTRRNSRSSSYEKLVFVCLGLLAVVSPLYINRAPVIDPEVDEQPINLAPWLPLLPLVLIFAIALSLYTDRGFTRSRRISSYEKFVGLGLGLLAVVSPLYINRRPNSDLELEEQPIDLSSWLPLLLLLLILAIALSLYLDQSLTRFDPYWIHRVGGSSGGIIVILVILALVLKCKASHGVKAE
ncbi:uncharacterized protein LOC8258588 [Ricinus communis]|uniref:Uncharacterized protein n=1 Tax=Ricinus communis TaxID=3988 RepID=B9RQX2_RICCO|nr:uncharacterized protein LOC8258588 [Ricinus communis]EEF46143.1 conserved hypothetical protein [Ricinus communis]|eukprot:XP_002516141.1 uncharacterized protein LOC8258588 [Ricinus communis]